VNEGGGIDLRLKSRKHIELGFDLGESLLPDGSTFPPLPPHPHPEVEFPAGNIPWHLNTALLSYFPRAQGPASLALDLGCGSGLHRGVVEHAGHRWIGLDYNDARAPILGDGHALPFLDGSIDFVVSIAVMEHIRYPFVLAHEVLRVLKPGGTYIGTVAFLEPFHGNSYYHHTHLGTYNTLKTAGFDVDHVAPNVHWSGLRAQASMGGLFPRMPPSLGRMLVWPLEALHKGWWRAGRLVSDRADERARLAANTGAFEFVAHRPA
jgi:SAM-dependent methyltransferase